MSSSIVSRVELIKTKILEKARAEADQIISEAEKRAEAILSRANEEAKSRQLALIKPKIDIIRRRIKSSAFLRDRMSLIIAKDEVMSEVMKMARERLLKVAMREDEEFNYDEILTKLIIEGARKIGEDQIVIIFNERDKRRMKKKIGFIEDELRKALNRDVKVEISEEVHGGIGGVIIRNVKGTKIYYNTFDGRLAKLQETLKFELSKILFT